MGRDFDLKPPGYALRGEFRGEGVGQNPPSEKNFLHFAVRNPLPSEKLTLKTKKRPLKVQF